MKKNQMKPILIGSVLCCILIIICSLLGSSSKEEVSTDAAGQGETDMKQKENSKPAAGKTVNYSFDDTYEILQELTEHEEEYDSIFECEKLAALRSLHEAYDVKFSMFCFEQADGYEIGNVTTRFQKEFEENSDWLRFGYHGKDRATKFDDTFSKEEFETSYSRVEQAITAFAGKESVCHTIRLHYFMCTQEEKEFLKKNGITGLFAADDERVSYDLTEEENLALNQERFFEKELFYYKTDLRLENVTDLETELEQLQGLEHAVIFTHEYELDRQLAKLEKTIQWFKEQGYTSSFFE